MPNTIFSLGERDVRTCIWCPFDLDEKRKQHYYSNKNVLTGIAYHRDLAPYAKAPTPLTDDHVRVPMLKVRLHFAAGSTTGWTKRFEHLSNKLINNRTSKNKTLNCCP